MKENVEENISQNHPEEIQEQLNQRKETNKGAIGLIVAISLVIIFVGVGAYAFKSRDGGDEINPTPTNAPKIVQETPTPTPDPYEGWQTYESEEFGFSIALHNGYKITEPDSDNELVWLTLDESNPKESTSNTLYFSVHDLVDGKTLFQTLQEKNDNDVIYGTLHNLQVQEIDDMTYYTDNIQGTIFSWFFELSKNKYLQIVWTKTGDTFDYETVNEMITKIQIN